MKKFFAKLIGKWEQRSEPGRFHPQGEVERMQAKEKVQEAREKEQERLHGHIKDEKTPSDDEILGPSDSKESKTE